MKLCFYGDVPDIITGAQVLGYEVSDLGTKILLRKVEHGLNIRILYDEITLEYSDKTTFFRALSILVYHLRKGTDKLELANQPNFDTCGVMIDVSRNAVLKLDTVKDIVKYMAKMGLNMIMLYTEDVYEIEKYPYFGYMRGAYTKEELKEIVEFADLFGIEIVPCIQTLAHIAKALRWPAFNEVKESADILLIDEPATYELIEEMIKTMRECFKSSRIHIGMDEANGVGFGKYFSKHGYVDKFELMTRHLRKVIEITNRYGFKPMMWSDMFFRLGSKSGDYYDLNAKMPGNIADLIPKEVSMVYWDYYNNTSELYTSMIQAHKQMQREIIFAGGIWTWGSLAVNYSQTIVSTRAGLESCRKENIRHVFATLWGDNGGECSVYEALLGMQLYAEYNYYDEVSDQHLDKMFNICTGYDAEAFRLLEVDGIDSAPYFTEEKEYSFAGTEQRIVTISKQAFYQDVLIGLLDKNIEMFDLKTHYKDLLIKLNNLEPQGDLEYLFEFHKLYVKILELKCDIGIRLKKAYDNKDNEALKTISAQLQILLDNVDLMHRKLADIWYKNNKPFGFETLDIRFGGLKSRIKRAKIRIDDFLDGKISEIEELKAERLYYNSRKTPFVHDYFAERIMIV